MTPASKRRYRRLLVASIWRDAFFAVIFFAIGGVFMLGALFQHDFRQAQAAEFRTQAYVLNSDGQWCNMRDSDCTKEWMWFWGAQQPAVTVPPRSVEQNKPNPKPARIIR